jgi:NADH-quinone oxidoreductase subunit N
MIYLNIVFLLILLFVSLIIGIIIENAFYKNAASTIARVVKVGLVYAGVIEGSINNWGIQREIYVIIIIIILLLIFFLRLIEEYSRVALYKNFYEVSLLFVPLVIGMMVLLKSTELLLILVVLEVQGVIFSTLVLYQTKTRISVESALKYFLTSALASILFMLGVVYLYGNTAFMDLQNVPEISKESLLIGNVLILISILIKIGAAPLHFYLIDVYAGTPLHILFFLMVFPKLFLFFLVYNLHQNMIENSIIIILLVCSGIAGSLGSLMQATIKRFIGYTVIFNNAFFLGLMLLTEYFAYISLIFSLLIYIIVTILSLLPIISLNLRMGDNENSFKLLRDLLIIKKTNFYIGLTIAISFLSAAGFPPFLGFFSKWYIFFPLIDQNYHLISYFLIIFSIIPAYYYLRISSLLFFLPEGRIKLQNPYISIKSNVIISFLLFVTCFFLVNPTTILFVFY